MKILIHSPAFLPMIGGLEINVATLAEAFAAHGHEVVVWTTTPGSSEKEPSARTRYSIVRRPSPREALRWVRWSNVFMHANISLHGVWPLLLVARPWVVSHHSWYCRPDGRIAWQDRLKRWALRYADASLAVSRALADDLATPTDVIPNAYRDTLFRVLPATPRDRDLAFVGRLVSDKGVDLLLEALARLPAEAGSPGLSLIGEGPELRSLEQQAQDLGLADRVHFLGTQTGERLVETLNRHRVLVVPSRYNEPFGIVALEGLACGCAVVGTAGGGLPEAIGGCGIVVENRSVDALASGITRLLTDRNLVLRLREAVAAHLAAHTVEQVSQRYLEVFRRVTLRQEIRG